MKFQRGTMVAWVTKKDTYMGEVIEPGEWTSVVKVTSAAKSRNLDGKKVMVGNAYLGDITSGKTVVTRAT